MQSVQENIPSQLGDSPLQSQRRSIISASRHRPCLVGLDCHTLLLHIEEPSVPIPELFLASSKTILRLQLTTAIAPSGNVRILLVKFCFVNSTWVFSSLNPSMKVSNISAALLIFSAYSPTIQMREPRALGSSRSSRHLHNVGIIPSYPSYRRNISYTTLVSPSPTKDFG